MFASNPLRKSRYVSPKYETNSTGVPLTIPKSDFPKTTPASTSTTIVGTLSFSEIRGATNMAMSTAPKDTIVESKRNDVPFVPILTLFPFKFKNAGFHA